MTLPVGTITDVTWSIGGLVFGAVDANGVAWVVNSAGTTGWYDGPDVNLNQNDQARGDGAYRADSYRPPRVIVIPGWCTAPSKPAAQAARRAFTGLYARGTQQTLTVVDGSETLTALVELAGPPKARPHAGGVGFDWQLTLSAADPRKYGPAQSASTGLPSVSATGVDWTGGGAGGADWTGGGAGGLDWGSGVSNGLVTVSNPGSADAWPVFTIVGPVTAPSITDGAGNVLAWTGPALASTDTLVITTNPLGPRSVLLNGGDNRASLTTAQFAAIPAQTAQTYQFGGSSAGAPSLTVTVAPAYW